MTNVPNGVRPNHLTINMMGRSGVNGNGRGREKDKMKMVVTSKGAARGRPKARDLRVKTKRR